MLGVEMEQKVYKMRANDPNVLMNKLIFPTSKVREGIIKEFCPKDIFRNQLAIDFNCLIPQPNYLYHGLDDGIGDFTYAVDWNLKNWQAADNAFNGTVEETKDEITIYFDIDFICGLIPYPIIVAIANLVIAPFTHLYYARNEEAWGIERYGIKDTCSKICISRLEKRVCDEADLLELRKEFLTTDELIEILAKERCNQCKKKKRVKK